MCIYMCTCVHVYMCIYIQKCRYCIGKYPHSFSFRLDRHLQSRSAYSNFVVMENLSMSNSHECMGVNGEALQLQAVYKKPSFLLQVTWKSVSGTTSRARLFWTCNEIEGSHDKISITIIPCYTKNITRLLPLALLLVLCTRNNTDGNSWYFPV